LFASRCVSTHSPPHEVCPAGQVHSPLLQTVPPAQRLLQCPQLSASVFVSTQAVPHIVRPAHPV
jgi:hypothetical protein